MKIAGAGLGEDDGDDEGDDDGLALGVGRTHGAGVALSCAAKQNELPLLSMPLADTAVAFGNAAFAVPVALFVVAVHADWEPIWKVAAPLKVSIVPENVPVVASVCTQYAAFDVLTPEPPNATLPRVSTAKPPVI